MDKQSHVLSSRARSLKIILEVTKTEVTLMTFHINFGNSPQVSYPVASSSLRYNLGRNIVFYHKTEENGARISMNLLNYKSNV